MAKELVSFYEVNGGLGIKIYAYPYRTIEKTCLMLYALEDEDTFLIEAVRTSWVEKGRGFFRSKSVEEPQTILVGQNGQYEKTTPGVYVDQLHDHLSLLGEVSAIGATEQKYDVEQQNMYRCIRSFSFSLVIDPGSSKALRSKEVALRGKAMAKGGLAKDVINILSELDKRSVVLKSTGLFEDYHGDYNPEIYLRFDKEYEPFNEDELLAMLSAIVSNTEWKLSYKEWMTHSIYILQRETKPKPIVRRPRFLTIDEPDSL